MMRLDSHGETTEDIMAEFKKAKFVVAPDYLGFGPTMVILSDISFWAPKYDVLGDWCRAHQCRLEGLTVNVPDEPTLMLFCLKWS